MGKYFLYFLEKGQDKTGQNMAEQNFKIFRNSHQDNPNKSRYFPCLMSCIKNTKTISMIVLLLILVIFGISFFILYGHKWFKKDDSIPFIESSSTG